MRGLAFLLLVGCGSAPPHPTLATLGPADRPCEPASPLFAPVVRDATLRWHALEASNRSTLTAALEQARTESTGQPISNEQTSETVTCFAHWVPTTERFEVTYTRKVFTWSARTTSSTGCGNSKRYPRPCAPRVTSQEERREYSASDGVIVRFDALGAAAGETWQAAVATPSTHVVVTGMTF